MKKFLFVLIILLPVVCIGCEKEINKKDYEVIIYNKSDKEVIIYLPDIHVCDVKQIAKDGKICAEYGHRWDYQDVPAGSRKCNICEVIQNKDQW